MFTGVGETNHLRDDRSERMKLYKKLGLLGEDFLYFFEVDNHHPNGSEVHAINGRGLIYIYNLNTKRFITIKHARMGQLYRYFNDLNLAVPNDIKTIALACDYRNKTLNLNNK